MISAISAAWSWLVGSKVGRTVALVLGALVGLFIYGKAKERDGAAKLKAKQALERERKIQEARNAAEKARKDLRDASDDDLDQRVRDAGL